MRFPWSKAAPVNQHLEQVMVFGPDPRGYAQGVAIMNMAQRANAGRNVPPTINPQTSFKGDAVVPIQPFMGPSGQHATGIGGVAPYGQMPPQFAQTASTSVMGDPVMAAFADQLNRGYG